ncbi:MAG: DUF3365 domain-containing protein [Caldithrix sp.]|nr:DUF3365 domain-containing protein [Caldithrix sp.]
MRLTSKITLMTVAIVTVIVSGIFYYLAKHYENRMEKQLLSTARAVYNNVVIIRHWVADNEGVFTVRKENQKPNPFLKHPSLRTEQGDTLLLHNPALVTRELSDLSYSIGKNYSFHLTSLKYINPANKPDNFEREALLHLEQELEATHNRQKEFYQTEMQNENHYFRYFAPLYTEKSCLSCHREQGYELGDIRGGISIMLPINDYLQNKRENLLFFILIAAVTILVLSGFLSIALRRIIINPLHSLEASANRMADNNYDVAVPTLERNEIGTLAEAFELMRTRIRDYTAKLKASESKYRSLIENSIEAVAIHDDDGWIIDCNQKLSSLSGYDPQELQKMNLFNLLEWQDKQPIRTADKDEEEHYESILKSKFSQRIPVEFYRLKGFILNGREQVSFTYMRDISERKKIENYSIQTEKIYALGQISSGIAHEIRNPLFALNNNLDYLNRHIGDHDAFNEVYPEFRDGIDRIQNIINAILDYAKPHELSFKSVDIKDIINNCLILVQKQFEKSSIKIETHFNHQNKSIEADAHQLEQVFLNLFLNAFKAMPTAGVLTVSTDYRKHQVRVDISDTGKGIPREEINRIFYPFYTKFPDGTGLGLANVQRILEQHQAFYRVESEVDMGTTFHLSFPEKHRRPNV